MREQKEHIEQINYNNKRGEVQFDLLSMSDLFARKDLTTSIHNAQQINFYMLLVITKGIGTHTIDFTDYSYQKGTILSIRKDQIHRFHPSDADGYLLLFTDDFLLSYFEKTEVARGLKLFNDFITSPMTQLTNSEYEDILKYINDIEHEYKLVNDTYSLDIISSLLAILFRKLFRVKSQNNQLFTTKKYLNEFLQFQELVEKRCLNSKKVLTYADEMAISTKTLNNITQQIIHKSAKQFIDETVIIQIKRLLVNTSYSIKEIAFRVGFDEATNLFKFFKRHTSVTPDQFRRANQ